MKKFDKDNIVINSKMKLKLNIFFYPLKILKYTYYKFI